MPSKKKTTRPKTTVLREYRRNGILPGRRNPAAAAPPRTRTSPTSFRSTRPASCTSTCGWSWTE
jgi:hypothetical protein